MSETSLKKRILIVDDESDFVNMTRFYFENRGYEVFSASDGEEGLKQARSLKPDIVLLDIMMPKMNGYQVCRELKKSPTEPTCHVIMLTAKSQESDKFWGMETGANEYITKPFDIEELEKKINNALSPTE